MHKLMLLGVNFSCVTMNEAVKSIEEFLTENKVHTIYTPNSEIMMCAQRDSTLKAILNSADMLVADGAGVILASKILNVKLPEKVSGLDLVKNSFNMKRNTKTRYFLFGGEPGIAEIAAHKIIESYSNIEIVGTHSGYFDPVEEQQIIQKINSSKAEILLVALGAPKQEKWIFNNAKYLNVKICIGVGGTLNILSGQTNPTPEIMRKYGFEWLHRLYKEPSRFKRMLDLPRFIMLAVFTRLKLK